MKQSGIARKLDKLGRIVVPIEARRSLGWEDTTQIEISLLGHYILLHEYEDSRAAPIEARGNCPIQNELNDALSKLSDKDTLMVLDLLRRFTTSESSNKEL